MFPSDESKKLVSKYSDRSRKSARLGSENVVPHKFKESGEIVTADNFNPRSDISRLTLDDFRLLDALRMTGWELERAAIKAGMSTDAARKRYKRLSYFRFEDAKAKALASVASPDFVTAQNLENFYTDKLSDGQRDSLKELAKITGAYKTTANLNITQNVFNLPKLAPEVEAEFKALAEKALEAEVVDERAA